MQILLLNSTLLISFFSFFSLFFLLVPSSVYPFTINRLNGGGSIIYIDFSIPGKVIPLELIRTYNSITTVSPKTTWQGSFGKGWTSQFETTLTVTPERHIILRDGATGTTVLFKPEIEDPSITENFLESARTAYHKKNLGRELNPTEKNQLKLPDKILAKLRTQPQFRLEFSKKYQMTLPLPKEEVLVSSDYGYQTIQFQGNQWIRKKDGVSQVFDSEGRLVQQIDKNGASFHFKYSALQKNQIQEISDPDHLISLKFIWKNGQIIEVNNAKSESSYYSYDTIGNLIKAVDSKQQVFLYKYENKKFPHLLTRIDYPSEEKGGKKVFREIQYDENGLITFHRDKDETETKFSYGKSPSDPENNFWTKSVRTSYAGEKEEQYDEYLIKLKTDGTKYLHKQENRQNNISTVTTFTPCCGKPSQVNRAGEITNYKYDSNGLLIEKIGPKEDLRVEYESKWKKISKVTQNGFVSRFEYDDRGNLVLASNSRNQKIQLRYDRDGRIIEIFEPQLKRSLTFKYSDRGKPILIEEKGVGKLRVEYDASGKINKTETIVSNLHGRNRKPSAEETQLIVKKLMGSFQQFLDLIRPAGLQPLELSN